MTFRGFIYRINKFLWGLRKKINKFRYPFLFGENSQISIISCNCIGGVLMSEYNMKFLSPTINLYFSAEDFLVFCENLEQKTYFNIEPVDKGISNLGDYPLVGLGDLTINAVHYKSFEEFYNAWNRRKNRINYDRIFLVFTDRDGFKPNMLNRISKLPYPKVLFSKQEFPEYDFVVCVPGFEKENCVGIMTDFKKGISSQKLYSYYPFVKSFKNMIKNGRR